MPYDLVLTLRKIRTRVDCIYLIISYLQTGRCLIFETRAFSSLTSAENGVKNDGCEIKFLLFRGAFVPALSNLKDSIF